MPNTLGEHLPPEIAREVLQSLKRRLWWSKAPRKTTCHDCLAAKHEQYSRIVCPLGYPLTKMQTPAVCCPKPKNKDEAQTVLDLLYVEKVLMRQRPTLTGRIQKIMNKENIEIWT